MKEVELGMVDYTGVDVVDNEVIAQNVSLYGSKNRHFFVADVTHDDLPRVDLILCRDVLTHLPNKTPADQCTASDDPRLREK